jgi:hypothetical protein
MTSEFETDEEPFVMEHYELRSKNKDFPKNIRKEKYIPSRMILERELLPYNKEAWRAINDYYKVLTSTKDSDVLYEIADIANAIDIYLFLNFVQAVDSLNYYRFPPYSIKHLLLSFKKYKDGYKVLYSPWDLDSTFGTLMSASQERNFGPIKIRKDIDEGMRSIPDLIKPNRNFIMNINPVWYLQQLGDEKINILVKDRYQELRRSSWSNDHLMELIDMYEAQIFGSGAYIREKERWPFGIYEIQDVELKKFKSYVNQRLYYMDQFVNEL